MSAAPLPELLRRQVRRTPDGPALASAPDGPTLSYAEVEAEAGRLARHLIETGGVGPESRVAVIAERSVTTVLTLLAVSMAGGAFVP
ncbi:AMP-binding protein, partial [Streptomyces sp. TRM76130]|nr:AMP-binding protein [Streptomyces sp. TRM76130]